MKCTCDQCQKARQLVDFAETTLGFELAPWQRSVMLNLARCSRSALASNWLTQTAEAARRRIDQTPPWARPVRVVRREAGAGR